ncbi:pseudouridine synthase [Crenobacter sp. SG2303]|uniref:Pseudouridine synthase n=1 Tax=Crenobacter oryzisoli TaxID=3056844 RepID=A0ABT7XMC2_9NEIS|nr:MULTISPECIES: pseudouridine synthase [unclassified Crenobacter]MDN0074958.1 pseudouridine synthase [Crenobacter sp. SG2303]MDN0081554.1 pseudouridine synthase [Crenobacter sp. SG2305]
MSQLILLNKPYGVICQFSEHPKHPTLKSCIDLPGVYPAGRLDTDSEGLLLLTDDGALQHRIADPRWKLPKTYWVQVEGEPSDAQLAALEAGVDLGDFVTKPATVRRLNPPSLWPRNPPVRFRKSVPDNWLEIVISEGKNRQVRRMTAKVGLPTLRLVRVAIGPWRLEDLPPGEHRVLAVDLADLPGGRQAMTRAKVGRTPPRSSGHRQTMSSPTSRRRKP